MAFLCGPPPFGESMTRIQVHGLRDSVPGHLRGGDASGARGGGGGDRGHRAGRYGRPCGRGRVYRVVRRACGFAFAHHRAFCRLHSRMGARGCDLHSRMLVRVRKWGAAGTTRAARRARGKATGMRRRAGRGAPAAGAGVRRMFSRAWARRRASRRWTRKTSWTCCAAPRQPSTAATSRCRRCRFGGCVGRNAFANAAICISDFAARTSICLPACAYPNTPRCAGGGGARARGGGARAGRPGRRRRRRARAGRPTLRAARPGGHWRGGDLGGGRGAVAALLRVGRRAAARGVRGAGRAR